MDTDILIVQEAEISEHSDVSQMNIKNFTFYCTKKEPKSRLAVYVKTNIKQNVIMSKGCEIILIKLKELDIFAVYRPFKIQTSDLRYVEKMFEFIKENLTGGKKFMIVGDCNFDYSKLDKYDFKPSKAFEKWVAEMESLGLTQLVNKPTWFRTNGDSLRSSTLDHIYVVEDSITINWDVKDLSIGDHLAILCKIELKNPMKEESGTKQSENWVRNWRGYSAQNFVNNLKNDDFKHLENWPIDQHAEEIANILMMNLNKTAPLTKYKRQENPEWSTKLVKMVRRKKNMRKKALKKKSKRLFQRVKEMSKKIVILIEKEKANKIKNLTNSAKGDPASFWKAVNLCKGNLDKNEIPSTLTHAGKDLNSGKEKAEAFQALFESKSKSGKIPEPNTYNGERLIFGLADEKGFSVEEIRAAFKKLKNKASQGHDRVPMRVLKDCEPVLINTVHNLFNKIYESNRMPETWRCSRIIPVHKKGSKTEIENYRPISNLCSIEKLYERCLLNRLEMIAKNANIDLTHEHQYGFKKEHSTTSLCLHIQERIAKHKLTSLVSVDLSAAFDLVDHNLLIKRMEIMGLPKKLCTLIKDWLEKRYYYVECENEVSSIKFLQKGTVQGSVLGPVLFSIFIRPMFDIEDLYSYADDSYILVHEATTEELIKQTEEKTNNVAKWLDQSGMVVNAEKTEFVIFPKKGEFSLNILGKEIKNKQTIQILGLTFSSDLTWEIQANQAIGKAKRAANGLRQLAKYIDKEKMLQLATAFGYSKMYYGAPVWLSPLLLKKSTMKRLLACSTNLIKSALNLHEWRISYNDIHNLANRGTPTQMAQYFLQVTLHGVWNIGVPRQLKENISNNIYHNDRHENFRIISRGKVKRDYNCFENRIISQINFKEFGKPVEAFKIYLKRTLW